MDKKTFLGIVILVGVVAWYLRSRPAPVESRLEKTPAVLAKKAPSPEPAAPLPPVSSAPARDISQRPLDPPRPKLVLEQPSPGKAPGAGAKFSLPFVIEDGVAVVQGDIVLGAPANGETSGEALVPAIQLWPSRVIPFYIQPNVPSPERIRAALSYFDNTPIQFVELNQENDALVFESANGTCKSYVGKMGGKQPVWIGPACGPHEVAHEIMHALGFVHEQNRDDRDHYIVVLPDNIEPDHIRNFEKMPSDFMKATGLGAFDFTSVMMYPKTMFGRNGLPTMESKVSGEDLRPSEELSPGDRARLQKAYGSP